MYLRSSATPTTSVSLFRRCFSLASAGGLLVLISLLTPQAALSQTTTTWQGTTSDWTNPSNWSNGAPANGPGVGQNSPVFNGGGVTAITNIPGTSATYGLSISGADYTFTYSSGFKYGSTITINSGTQTFQASAVSSFLDNWNVAAGANVVTGANVTLTGSPTTGPRLAGGGNYTINGNTSSLTQNTSGLVTINGNTSGNITVNAGTLAFNGSATTGTGIYSINSGATLSGHGTFAGNTTVNSGATLAPGAGVGIMTFSNALTLGSTATTSFDINGTTRGTSYDSLNLSGATLLNGTLALNFGTLFSPGDSLNLFNYNSVTPTGDFSAVTGAGSYSGSFTQSGTTWSLISSGSKLTFDEQTGLLTVAIPEVATTAALASGAVLGVALWRRRRKAAAAAGQG